MCFQFYWLWLFFSNIFWLEFEFGSSHFKRRHYTRPSLIDVGFQCFRPSWPKLIHVGRAFSRLIRSSSPAESIFSFYLLILNYIAYCGLNIIYLKLNILKCRLNIMNNMGWLRQARWIEPYWTQTDQVVDWAWVVNP